ncbi:hypothetical protein BTN50_2016 [Candidatus Enterovibrio altilux]|uniref:Uncharacterized protein n=1 Tax=Candidatus Enterovibrio altilux TaxID=1927128 RepID=A0A291BBR1_9GAMM|nr:hypothetical protein BTN50_2016 [Candidatus Enterovibrio luxaltus]
MALMVKCVFSMPLRDLQGLISFVSNLLNCHCAMPSLVRH